MRRAVWGRSAIIAAILISGATACTKSRKPTPDPTPTPSAAQTDPNIIQLTSTAFKEGQPIPRAYTCDGVNVSPSLEWTGVPKSAQTLAMIVDDPDAPAGTWVHWVVFNLPADNIGMVENTPSTEELKGGGLQGKNDFDQIGYGGPCPPAGTHRYFFKIYALDTALSLKAGATKADVEKAMAGHIILQGQLMGTYRK